MVKIVSPTDKENIGHAIVAAERVTSAEMVTVVASVSDPYQSYVLLYGLMAGSAIDIGLWAGKVMTAFPLLLAIQLAAMALLSFIPCVRRLCVRFVPKSIRHRRAAHRAFEEYLVVSRHLPSSAPIVLLYVSVAEHYAHILTSRAVREKIPDENWNAVIAAFTSSIKNTKVQEACIDAIERMAQLLAPHFPARG